MFFGILIALLAGFVIYLLVERANKQKQLLQTQAIAQENLFRGVLYNNHASHVIHENLEAISLGGYRNGGIVALFTLEKSIRREDFFTIARRLPTFFSISERVPPQLETIFIPLQQNQFCLLFTESGTERVSLFLQQVKEAMQRELGIQVEYEQSSPIETIEGFHAAFSEVSFSNKMYIYPFEMERYLMDALENNDIAKGRKLLMEILDKNLRQMELDTYNIVTFKYALLNTVERILNNHNQSVLGFSRLNQDLFQGFTDNNPEKLYDGFVKIFENIFQEHMAPTSDIGNPTAENILHFIHDHYMTDLSLTMISDHFGLTESHISRLLKESANIKFKKYLSGLKIERAKELMQKEDYKISEISNMVGYKNVNTFIRMFKNQEGISPGEYKKYHAR